MSSKTCYIVHTPLEDVLYGNNKQLCSEKRNAVHQGPIKTTSMLYMEFYLS